MSDLQGALLLMSAPSPSQIGAMREWCRHELGDQWFRPMIVAPDASVLRATERNYPGGVERFLTDHPDLEAGS
jgi:hypothetical protein